MIQRLFTRFDVAAFLGITTDKVDRLVRSAELPCIELPGGDVRFDPDDLAEWARSHRRPVAANVGAR